MRRNGGNTLEATGTVYSHRPQVSVSGAFRPTARRGDMQEVMHVEIYLDRAFEIDCYSRISSWG